MNGRAVVIGSGPNGMAAAITLARAGLDVEVREAASIPGGGARSAELTLPGFVHDVCSAVFPMAAGSPFFAELPLASYGLEWIRSPAPLAHPLDDGSAVILERGLRETAVRLGVDGDAYTKLLAPAANYWPALALEVLRPLRVPRQPFLMAWFGLPALLPAAFLARRIFKTREAQVLFAGLAAHSILRLEAPLSAAFGMIMGGTAHAVGWPIAKGGTQQITNALAGVLASYGGRVTTNARVETLGELHGADLVLCDVTPRQFLRLARNRLPHSYQYLLEQYRYGPGVFKMDWALSEPIPWKAEECKRAATVHLGGSLEEIAASERDAWEGRVSSRPFVLLAQQSLFDGTRAPAGKHTAWAYCHVPNGWRGSMREQIEAQVERFAPGFRQTILERSALGPEQLEARNENLVGGDINGGSADWRQFLSRPTFRTYSTPLKGVYLCSSSTPPGGGVHGMCGYNAAHRALMWLKRTRVR